MAEARQLKSRKWRLYESPNLHPVRDPKTGKIPTFQSLMEARRWWLQLHPQGPPLQEAVTCAKCGAYFGQSTSWTLVDGRYYHSAHSPQAVGLRRRA